VIGMKVAPKDAQSLVSRCPSLHGALSHRKSLHFLHYLNFNG
jgi:hypothetical protein